MGVTANLGITYLEPSQAQPHVTINEAMDNLDKAIAGALEIDCTAGGTIVLTGAQSTNHVLVLQGTPGAGFTVEVQALPKTWVVRNETARTATVKHNGTTGVAITTGADAHVYSTGTEVYAV